MEEINCEIDYLNKFQSVIKNLFLWVFLNKVDHVYPCFL